MRPPRSRLRVFGFASRHCLTFCALLCVAMLGVSSSHAAAEAQCDRDGAYDPSEIVGSVFFSTRQQTKFAPSERHYPLPSHASARYCFSRGCTGQLDVKWTEDEQQRLLHLRRAIVEREDARSELHFIKIATLQMETWLYARLRSLDQGTVKQIHA